jgi:uncharacterized membrane-anchored protein
LSTNTIRNWAAIIILGVWTLAAIVAFFTANLTELGIITPVAVIVTGFLFGYKQESQSQQSQGHEKEDEKWSHLP